MRKEINLCKEAGCKACCCRNISMVCNGDELKKFPGASELNHMFDVLDTRLTARGVYWAAFRNGVFVVKINGDCPNLGEDGNCGIYKNRPKACRDFERGSEACGDARKMEGLVPIDEIV